MKNWKGFFHKAMAGQFVKDLMNMKELGEIVWVFNRKGANSKLEYLKGNVMKALRKADGSPIDELKEAFEDRIFIEKIAEWIDLPPDQTSPDAFLEWLNDDYNFMKIFRFSN